MRIGLNAQIVSRANAGVATYASNVIRDLMLLESRHEFYVFGSQEFLSDLDSPRVKLLPTSTRVKGSWRRILWEQSVLPIKARRHGVEMMYYPDHTGPLIKKTCPVVITIHDLAYLAEPQTFAMKNRMYKSFAVRRSARLADKIIVVSEATKKECLRWLDIPESKLCVIYNGIDACFRRIEDHDTLETTRKKFALPKKFILFVGTLEPRKNVSGLIQAYAALKKKQRLEHDLVIVGGKGWLYSEIFATVHNLALTNEVKFLGYVAQDDVVALYNLAEVFVYPSIYEGFGFPPLEAMACGCPVVTSNRSSLPEVVGDAAMLVDCRDPNALADGIYRVASDENCRSHLKEKGMERVKLFDWQKAARQILQVFDEVAMSSATTS
jgi:glycosyltransferase involved in cell wall biosynthesis